MDIGADGTFAFNRSDDVLWGGAISGTGNLVQIGPGRLDLAGGAGNGFTGDLYVPVSYTHLTLPTTPYV